MRLGHPSQLALRVVVRLVVVALVELDPDRASLLRASLVDILIAIVVTLRVLPHRPIGLVCAVKVRVLSEVATALQVRERVGRRAEIICVRLRAYKFDLVLEDLEARLDGVTTVASESLQRVLTQFPFANLSIAFESAASLAICGLFTKRRHPFALLNVVEVAIPTGLGHPPR